MYDEYVYYVDCYLYYFVGVWVVYEGVWVDQWEFVDEGVVWLDVWLVEFFYFVYVGWQEEVVLVDCGVFWQFVGDQQVDMVVFLCFDQWFGCLVVVVLVFYCYVGSEFMFDFFGDEMKFFDVVFYDVGQC